MTDRILTLDELAPHQHQLAGGKGSTLAKLYQAGYPVPDGFVIPPDAFVEDELTAEAWSQVQSQLNHMRKIENGMASFAVRSSGLSEDSTRASFAGEFETVLDVHTDEAIRAAIHSVRQSRHSERVQAYSAAQGLDTTHSMAVVVQRLIRADISGVLFTANPVTGNRSEMTGNFVFGFGEELVSGEAEPYAFTIQRPRGDYEGPQAMRRFARKLFKLASRLESELGAPQDIEWAILGSRLFLLQSRPITTLIDYNPATGERNASLTGDYLWTNIFTVEVFPRAMMQSTWSVWKLVYGKLSLGRDQPTIGCIGGRPYLNYSLMYSFLAKLLQSQKRARDMMETMVSLPPEGIQIPPYPVSAKTILFETIPREIKTEQAKRKLIARRDEFLSSLPARCQQLRQQIRTCSDGDRLASTWRQELKPLFLDMFTLQDAYNERFAAQNRNLTAELAKILSQEDADLLLSSISSGTEQMASVGPLLGLAKLRREEISAGEYLERFGHRAPYENYLSKPRPYEDPDWLEVRLLDVEQGLVDVPQRLEDRGAEFAVVWERLGQTLPSRQRQKVKRRMDEMNETCLIREATRSELSRVVGVIRDLFLRAGELSGLGEGVFHLTVDELIDLLSGDDDATKYILARREAHEKLEALPHPPIWIRGRFDLVQWAADPDRRLDIFDAHGAPPSLDLNRVVKGNPGSAGCAEGTVRRIDSPEQGHELKSGEILVTGTTNVGWTPLFPRAAAIVTDIGGALSHAAIVAREIGIPAVVGCGSATMRLQTGDRVRVDGAHGTVEILAPAQVKP